MSATPSLMSPIYDSQKGWAPGTCCFMENAGAEDLCSSQRVGAEDLCFSQRAGAEDLCSSQRAGAEDLCFVGLSTTSMSPTVSGVSAKKHRRY